MELCVCVCVCVCERATCEYCVIVSVWVQTELVDWLADWKQSNRPSKAAFTPDTCSPDTSQLTVLRTGTKYGDRSFSVNGPVSSFGIACHMTTCG